MQNLELIIILLTVATLLAAVTEKIKFPLPILLMLVGLLISAIPGLPTVVLSPEVVFLVFLPPLLYEAAWVTDFNEFRANLRPIGLAGVGLEFFTTTCVAWAAHRFIPGFGWAEAFVLGAIVSPPDAVAATSVLKGLGLHKRVMAILEGESLVNDAAGLIAYRYALAAVATGSFVLWQASLTFAWVAVAGVAVGLAVGYGLFYVHRKLTDNPTVETTLSFLTSYASYLLAEHLHVSGVLAVVTTALYLSHRQRAMFSAATLLHANAVWRNVAFILNGLIFILIGLQLRTVLAGMAAYSAGQLLGYATLVSAVVMVVRFVWSYPAAYVPRWLSRRIRQREYFSHANVFVFSWAGMRGVVSMAAALAVPLTLPNGQPFPHRNLILFLTFGVIVATLVVQGLTLPLFIKWLRIEPYSTAEEELRTRLRLAAASIEHIEENLALGLDGQVLNQLKSKYEVRYNRLRESQPEAGPTDATSVSATELARQFNAVQCDLLVVERGLVGQIRREGEVADEVLRKIEHELNLEEARLSLEGED